MSDNLKVLLIGNGAREHCIAEAIVNSNSFNAKLFSLMSSKNPGVSELVEKSGGNFYIGKLDSENAVKIAEQFNFDLAMIGPEAPLALGVADALRKKGILVLGPNKNAARIETSKGFARELLKKYEIKGFSEFSYPDFRVFDHFDRGNHDSINSSISSLSDIKDYLKKLKQLGQDYVLKPDGLTGGKGVKVKGEHFFTDHEALNYCSEVLSQSSESKIVIEEKLDGEEFSLQCFVDGKNVAAMPPVQDHKRAFADDSGSNTGGMGSYSYPDNLPFLSQHDIDEAVLIVQRTVDAMNKEGIDFRGVLYGGFIAGKNSVKLIEYNARFGDPEAMNVIPLINTLSDNSDNSRSFLDICIDVAQGDLNNKTNKMVNKIRFDKKATVCKYLVPEGYPDSPVGNEKITVDMKVDTKNMNNKSDKKNNGCENSPRFYWSSVSEKEDGIYSSNSRTIAVLGIHENIEEAENIAQRGVESVKGKLRYRRDVGTKHLIQKRMDHMKRLRGV